jgi:hypothetical protein
MGDCQVGPTEEEVARDHKEHAMKEASHIIDILRARGGVILDGSGREPAQLIECARAAAILRNMGDHSVDQLLEITRAGKGRVVLELDSSTLRQRTQYVGPFQESGLSGL